MLRGGEQEKEDEKAGEDRRVLYLFFWAMNENRVIPHANAGETVG